MKSLYWIGAIFILAVIVLFMLSGGGAEINPALEIDKINPNDHVRGNASSTVIVFEYGYFQCPACRSYYPLVREMEQEYGDKVAFVFRHFPLAMHMNAEFAARAAEASAKQGKFWEMHDLLYEKQEEWANQSDFSTFFEGYAKLIGISVDQFKTDFNSKEVKDLVKGYKNYGNSIGIQGTPTFYIGGKKIENPTSAEAFKLLINQALKK